MRRFRSLIVAAMAKAIYRLASPDFIIDTQGNCRRA